MVNIRKESIFDLVIAYVFWHWKKPAIPADRYEERQKAFHAALAAAPPAGFIRSLSVAFAGSPWTGNREAYEDWYLVEDFGALGFLNEGAVSASRAGPHDAAAAAAEGGAGAVYALRHGKTLVRPRYAHWFGKPTGMPYKECFAQLAPRVDEAHGALWMRQMALGPAREFCLHSGSPVAVPSPFEVLQIPLRQIWPIMAGKPG